ncbi:uncharacterized protein C8Q71DRAFT_797679 [Rhodofomes roseus]|uniref:Protein kinase domain-containing protein n=1 Tax=Rhodofomes roseus TaxID=34475 RepID=A0ABQ8KBJ6_9APHY|nr:uncharacterized protein C8Q71DRAFT_797679 [Rhodofomes roseus]KAH9834890.1 hypothetical protein C8Q71DRAFT_797679 [Rhodofomes roseus]
MTSQPSNPETDAPVAPGPTAGGLARHEYFWRDRQPWIREHGYVLRPRYAPDWKPSWLDSQRTLVDTILDATQQSDGMLVTLKAIDTAVHPFEVEIGQFLSSEQSTKDPRNHCVRILEVLQEPSELNKSMIVMPFLKKFDAPDFLTNRDDWRGLPSFTRDFSGWARHCSRTERPPRYFYIDFGLSRKCDPADGPPLELPVFGGDRTVPEFQEDGYDVPADPFRTDIYYLGNLIRTTFSKASIRTPTLRCMAYTNPEYLQEYRGFEFIEQLVADMVQSDPQKRPTIAEVETRFDAISRELSWWKLRTRLVYKDETVFERAVLSTVHFFRTAKFLAKRRPPIPTPFP